MDDFRRRPVNRAIKKDVTLNGNFVNISPSLKPWPVEQSLVEPGDAVAVQSGGATPVKPNLVSQSIVDGSALSPKKPSGGRLKRIIIWLLVSILTILIALGAGTYVWYGQQLKPVDETSDTKKVVTIKKGSNPTMISELLYEEGLIRSQLAFMVYTRVERVQGGLQAGTYRLSPSESTQDIVKHLSSGSVDTFSITFLPGATLMDNREAFIKAGYEANEVDLALSKSYDSSLFNGKPASADLEGYIYGETYSFSTDATVESILEHTFEQYYSVVKSEGLEAKFKAQGLSLYEGITLASIIQREASPGGSDMPQIAQVFYTRMERGMELGSDVTYQYIADKTGVPRSPNLDSPYNTRKYPGLPPGPISAPGKKALVAAANPAKGDYVYFLSGDDDITYYAKTLDGHEANIRNHCQEKCKIL